MSDSAYYLLMTKLTLRSTGTGVKTKHQLPCGSAGLTLASLIQRPLPARETWGRPVAVTVSCRPCLHDLVASKWPQCPLRSCGLDSSLFFGVIPQALALMRCPAVLRASLESGTFPSTRQHWATPCVYLSLSLKLEIVKHRLGSRRSWLSCLLG